MTVVAVFYDNEGKELNSMLVDGRCTPKSFLTELKYCTIDYLKVKTAYVKLRGVVEKIIIEEVNEKKV